MRLSTILVLVVGAAACQAPADRTVVATYSGGVVSLGDVEEVLFSLSVKERVEREREIVEGYRSVARRIALTRLLVPETLNFETRLDFLRRESPELWRRTVVRSYFLNEVHDPQGSIVTEKEAEAYYREHHDEFIRLPRRKLTHIFRRAAADGNIEDAIRVLEGIRRRIVSGGDPEALAREFSESESRNSGGALGWIDTGVLPPALEEIAFSLGRGETSQPFPVPGGAAIFHVGDAVEEKAFSFDDVHLAIERDLSRRKIEDGLAAATAEIEMPEGAVVLDHDGLMNLLRDGGADDLVLTIGDGAVTRGEFLQTLAVEARSRRQRGDQDLAWMLYRRLVNSHLLLHRAVTSGYLDRPQVRNRIESELRPVVERGVVEGRIRERIREGKEEIDLPLRIYYEENQKRYQSSLSYRVRLLVVDELVDPTTQMRMLVDSVRELEAGGTTLDAVAQEVGGSIRDPGWLDFQQLGGVDPKIARFLVELQPGGFSVPYQLGNSIQIIELIERRDPAELSYEEVQDRVFDDYLERYRDSLYDDVVDTILEGADFRFMEDNVRSVLAPPDAFPDSGSQQPEGSQ